jgi:hypothetical protein
VGQAAPSYFCACKRRKKVQLQGLQNDYRLLEENAGDDHSVLILQAHGCAEKMDGGYNQKWFCTALETGGHYLQSRLL